MEIQCPSCQKKLSIGDQFAGELVKCPACSGVFMAPSLSMPAMPVAAPVSTSSGLPTAGPVGTLPMTPALSAQTQAAAPDVIPFSSEPPARPSYPHVPPLPKPAPSSHRVEFEEEPPGPPSDFKRSYTMRLSPDILRWVGPVALAVLLVLSFFSWVAFGGLVANLGVPIGNLNIGNFNLWNMA